MTYCFNLSIIPVFLLSEAYYLFYSIGLRVYCTGTNSAYFSASHPICREVGDWLFLLEMFLIAPLIMLGWFLTIQRRGQGMAVLRFLGMAYLLFVRFAIAYSIGAIEIEPSAPIN